jgi:bifunctional non-homologous end joining protein LigD
MAAPRSDPKSSATKASLRTYRAKRDPAKTPEPMGDRPARRSKSKLKFVIQEHHARALHWDLRLEHDGVLASWALPKGIPEHPKVNHLAVHTEDHPIDYDTFEGEIPAGEYGGGTMRIWDRGTYELEKWKPAEEELDDPSDGPGTRGLRTAPQERGADAGHGRRTAP